MSENEGQKPPPKPPEERPVDDEEAKKAAAAAAARAKAEREAAEAAKPAWERDPETPEWGDAADDELVQALESEHGEAILEAQTFAGDLVLDIAREQIRAVCTSLRATHGYRLMVDVCGADYPEREGGRFDVIYIVYSPDANRRVRLRVRTDESTPVPTVSSVWAGANWPEREVFDMYGVRFTDHPDMTRILLWEGFNGHPLRKEFPVEGIDTGSAIYPEYYEEAAGPVAGTGTGWKPAKPPEPPEPEPAGEEPAD